MVRGGGGGGVAEINESGENTAHDRFLPPVVTFR